VNYTACQIIVRKPRYWPATMFRAGTRRGPAQPGALG
jgi:hypothetical protein